MIKAIIFDFYGVIRSDEYHDWLYRHGIQRGDKSRKLSKDLNKGLTTIDQFFESLSKLSGMPADEIKSEFKNQGSLNQRLLALILELKKHYKICLLSNASSSHIRDILEEAGVIVLFDEIIISSEVGYIKPSNKIFEYTLKKLGVNASEALFIDDNESFCQAATNIGINSIYYRGYDSLAQNLKEIGIINN